MAHPLQALFDSTTIYLASHSPRRKELLRAMGVPFQLKSNHYQEPELLDCPAEAYAQTMALAKAKALEPEWRPNDLIICADTVVLAQQANKASVLGKASNKAQALDMLMALSGQTQTVHTGVAMRSNRGLEAFAVSTTLRFKNYGEAEANYYLEAYQPYDKAGAYGVQEWLGMCMMESLQGSYYNVVGLPTERLYDELMNLQNTLADL